MINTDGKLRVGNCMRWLDSLVSVSRFVTHWVSMRDVINFMLLQSVSLCLFVRNKWLTKAGNLGGDCKLFALANSIKMCMAPFFKIKIHF